MKKTKAVVYYRRKREGRTDYRTRLALLKSRLPRLVVRKSNKHLVLQIVEYAPDGDKVCCTVTTAGLKQHGWKRATGNLPAAYLVGLLLASKAKAMKEKKIDKIIVDIGLQTHKPGSRLYAAIKGAKDGGLNVVCSEEVFPTEERVMGKHISDALPAEVAAVKEKILKV